MGDDHLEDWEQFPDAWYDIGGEMDLRAHRLLLENCYKEPSAEKEE